MLQCLTHCCSCRQAAPSGHAAPRSCLPSSLRACSRGVPALAFLLHSVYLATKDLALMPLCTSLWLGYDLRRGVIHSEPVVQTAVPDSRCCAGGEASLGDPQHVHCRPAAPGTSQPGCLPSTVYQQHCAPYPDSCIRVPSMPASLQNCQN